MCLYLPVGRVITLILLGDNFKFPFFPFQENLSINNFQRALKQHPVTVKAVTGIPDEPRIHEFVQVVVLGSSET